MPSLFERLGRSLTRKKHEDPPTSSSEKRPSTTTERDSKRDSVSATATSSATTESTPAQGKLDARHKKFSRAKSPSARPVPTQRVPVLSLHLPELKDAAVAKALRLTFEATVEDPELTPEAITKRRLTPPEAVYLAKQTSGALHGKGMQAIYGSTTHCSHPRPLQASTRSASSNHTGTRPRQTNNANSLLFSFNLLQMPQRSPPLPGRPWRSSRRNSTRPLLTISRTS
jgi:hypothetical protein